MRISSVFDKARLAAFKELRVLLPIDRAAPIETGISSILLKSKLAGSVLASIGLGVVVVVVVVVVVRAVVDGTPVVVDGVVLGKDTDSGDVEAAAVTLRRLRFDARPVDRRLTDAFVVELRAGVGLSVTVESRVVDDGVTADDG